jgi:hypothetical protein
LACPFSIQEEIALSDVVWDRGGAIEAFGTVAETLSLGSVRYEAEVTGERLIWLEASAVHKFGRGWEARARRRDRRRFQSAAD